MAFEEYVCYNEYEDPPLKISQTKNWRKMGETWQDFTPCLCYDKEKDACLIKKGRYFEMNVSIDRLPEELQFGAAEVLRELGTAVSAQGVPLTATKGDVASVRREGEGIAITYTRRCEFFRALSRLSTLLKDGKELCESNGFDTLCLMADMSRNAVMNVPSVKQMLRTLALMGYDSFMLYTEDTYEVEGEPYFGYMRGRYTEAEMREIDDYADALGIEVIPCMQTLAHLECALRWKETYKDITDIDAILLVGEEKTYAFIDRMIGTLSACFRSRRINLGMDEAHNLGRGQYRDRNGCRKSSDVMLEHLGRVVEICNKYHYKPMIWSDMFFRMAFGTYRVEEGEIPPEVIAKVPEGLTLINWDYYSSYSKKKRLVHTMELHKKFNNPIAFAGGAWKWYGFAPHNAYSLEVTELHLDTCAEYGVKDIIATAWGDNGAECSHFAVLPSLLYYAEYAYCGKPDATLLEQRARECFDIGFAELCTLDVPNQLLESDTTYPHQACKYLLFNDPLEGLLDLHVDPATAPAVYRANVEKLEKFASHARYGYLFENLAALCRVLTRKCDLSIRLRAAYRAGEKETLAAIAAEIPQIVADLDDFLAVFRRQWYRENKTFGFSVQEIRIGGLRARLLSAKDRVEAYLAGEVARIEELEQEILPFHKTARRNTVYTEANTWEKIVTACRM